MIGDKDPLANLGTDRYYHRQAVAELADLRQECGELRAELVSVRSECDGWSAAYEQLRDDRNGWRARAILAEQQLDEQRTES